MNATTAEILAVIILGLAMRAFSGGDKMYDHLFKKYASMAGVKWQLLKAISYVESRYNPQAINLFEGKGRASIGLMQILYPSTLNALNKIYHKKYTKYDLWNPDINVHLAALLIRDIRNRYTDIKDVIASYNAGSPRIQNGKYINYKYVDMVYTKYIELTATERKRPWAF